MSCEDCNKIQESEWTSYYRWGTANIEVRACEKHITEVYDALNAHQKRVQEANEDDNTGYKPCPTCDGFGTVKGILGRMIPCPDCSSVGDLDT